MAEDVSLTRSALPQKAGVGDTDRASWSTRSMRQQELTEFSSPGHDCPTCDRSFTTRSGLGRHHALTHGEKLPKPTVECSNCSVEIHRDTYEVENHDHWFCDIECESEWKQEHSSEWFQHRLDDRIEAVCDECGESFTHPPCDDRRFCDRECNVEWRTGRFTGPENWDYKERTDLACSHCGEEFSVIPSREDRQYCSKACVDAARSELTGPDHPLWKGGVDWYRAIRSALGPTGWHTQRTANLGSECELCEATDRTLALHHIVPVLSGGTNAGYNYMTLCRGCHSTVENYIQQFNAFDPILAE